MISKKVIILVMCSSNDYYKKLEYSIKETWFNFKNDNVEIIFYSDNVFSDTKESNSVLIGNDLILPCGDGVQNCGVKTILAFDWVSKNYEYEYIYRSNLGSYVDVDNLLNFISDKPNNNFYCGIIGVDNFYYGESVRFASGSGYFLSNDLVNLVLNNREYWNHRVVDDVELGFLLKKLNVDIDPSAKRMNFCSGVIDYNIGDKFVDKIPDDDIYHIRLRSDNREDDINNMKIIYLKKINK